MYINGDIKMSVEFTKQETKGLVKASILKWEKIKEINTNSMGEDTCPLCMAFIADGCIKCPIQQFTKKKYCLATPYIEFNSFSDDGWASTPQAIKAAAKEIKFLKKVLKGMK